MADDESPTRYRFGPLERRGLVAGWRGGQIAAVATGLVVAVGILRLRPSPLGAVVAFTAVAAGVATATWPLRGRTAEQWAPDAARHVDVIRAQRKQQRRQPFATMVLLPVDLGATGVVGARLGTATRQRGPSDNGQSAGVIHDVAGRTYTAVLRVSGPGFVLLGAADKARRVDAWAGVLASLAREGTAVHRVQWIERSLPDDGAEVRRHILERAVVAADSVAHRSYAELVDGEVAAVHRHEVMLAVTVHAGHSARAVRAAGGGQRGACALLLRETASLARRLGEAGLDVAGTLAPGALADAVRRGFDADTAARERSDGQDRMARSAPLRSPWPGPMGMLPEWGRLRTDATWHTTYWIAEWPRTDVGADFLGPLLLVSDIRRSVSVVMEPVGPLRAARRIEQARTADIADAELRRRGGFLATARRRREEDVLVQREGELADGHASFRFSGYVTVSASDTDALEEACGRVEQVAGQAGLELRRCYGDQALAFTCTLPFGRGLA
ncbi:MAG TPA: SCO6880 family protein [Acidimicrobiales bacterium]|nr:SCO6880 family protein [Acidimicrobiales bacterium]